MINSAGTLWLASCMAVILINSTSGIHNFRRHRHRFENIVSYSVAANSPKEEWFDQKLDHSDPQSGKTWKQRYFTNATFFTYQKNSPVFLMIGGEGPLSEKWMSSGAWIEYAKKYGALCFQLEHRFYGESHPTEDMSIKNLDYLTSEQALDDLAFFIKGMTEKYSLLKTNRWFAFGGSYPGSLAAWARLKYPHLIHASISTSGPLVAKADFKEYYEVVKNSLATYDASCVTAVHDANQHLDSLIKTDVGLKYIAKQFKLCKPLNVKNPKDVQNFFEGLADNFAGVVQYNKDNRLGPKSNVTIETLCDIMMNEKLGTPVERYARVNEIMHDESCNDFQYDSEIKELQQTEWNKNTSEGARQWTYQTCTEFGFFQTQSSKTDLFGPHFPLDFFVGMCKDIYGESFTPRLLEEGISRTNINYGGLDIMTSRVVFVHGSIDPWHALGITISTNKQTPAIYIEGTAHCANMYPPSEKDFPQLKKAREDISELIGVWLNQ
uniref:Seminal fluid protein n=1 Tax=Nilaparvata lugens TaxID=108931 RepID=A0A1I9WL59_NILLU|nr:seminal fluid protein [Nilaparvata lugens]